MTTKLEPLKGRAEILVEQGVKVNDKLTLEQLIELRNNYCEKIAEARKVVEECYSTLVQECCKLSEEDSTEIAQFYSIVDAAKPLLHIIVSINDRIRELEK